MKTKLVKEKLNESFSRNNTDKLRNLSIGKIDLIEKWLNKYNIENYEINEDFTIDVIGTVNLEKKSTGNFPSYIQFGVVTSGFWCEGCNLTTLRGCPITVRHTFKCNNNFLISLEHCPQNIGDNFACGNNKLTSLKYSPRTIGGGFFCSNNDLTSLENAPWVVHNNFYCRKNNISSLDNFSCLIHGDLILKENPISEIEIEKFKNSGHNNIKGDILWQLN